MIVVSAGAKAILDLRATLERLETASVLVIGYGTMEFPAFYSRASGLKTALRLDAPEEIAELWMRHRALGMKSSLLVANPIPETDAIPSAEAEKLIAAASSEATQKAVSGQALTPFLLQRLGELSDGRLRRANVALLLNNAQVAARIAAAVVKRRIRRKGRAMKSRFSLKAHFAVKPEVLYRAWLSSKGHSEMTGSVAKVQARVGGQFSAWDGYITGRTLELQPPSRIVQAWRTGEFAESDPDSRVEIVLENAHGGTSLTLTHTDIPEGQAESYRTGWEEWYFGPMREYFGS